MAHHKGRVSHAPRRLLSMKWVNREARDDLRTD